MKSPLSWFATALGIVVLHSALVTAVAIARTAKTGGVFYFTDVPTADELYACAAVAAVIGVILLLIGWWSQASARTRTILKRSALGVILIAVLVAEYWDLAHQFYWDYRLSVAREAAERYPQMKPITLPRTLVSPAPSEAVNLPAEQASR